MTQPNIVILSGSLNADSNSRVLAQEAQRQLEQNTQRVTWVDLRDYALPLCDAGPAYGHRDVTRLRTTLGAADAIIVAAPIYNYDVNAALKNAIELTGDAWENKVVGFLCAAGGMNSYMSIMGLANSLMLDFRSIIVPRFVYATSAAIAAGKVVDPEIARRIGELTSATVKLASALAPASAAVAAA